MDCLFSVLKSEGASSVEILGGLGWSHIPLRTILVLLLPSIQVSRNLGTLFILTSWHRGYGTRSVMYTLNPEPIIRDDLQSYILRGEIYPPHSCQSRQSQMSFLPVFLILPFHGDCSPVRGSMYKEVCRLRPHLSSVDIKS